MESRFSELLPAESSFVCFPARKCSHGGKDVAARHRIPEPDTDDLSSTRFTRHFSAYRLEHIAGFKIGWTHNLLDHLLLIDTESEVKVLLFHHTRLLDDLESLDE